MLAPPTPYLCQRSLMPQPHESHSTSEDSSPFHLPPACIQPQTHSAQTHRTSPFHHHEQSSNPFIPSDSISLSVFRSNRFGRLSSRVILNSPGWISTPESREFMLTCRW
ncbi:hypothetical protein BDY17DRAFT_164500 [Neohortaea acidophila]|uniref:Uncharacterized protein n=1 Tax=Neohortaea acidophila TaxID=245834 RepID=A0A6A6PU01_9PEZI|nr:uncharacterized protein BDY17DRAFT_164500 [Neohortaea acidophila]KAF2482697.1 hypothetical protein BDY17DRAFT_164500 [Neohortaea acidophila]